MAAWIFAALLAALSAGCTFEGECECACAGCVCGADDNGARPDTTANGRPDTTTAQTDCALRCPGNQACVSNVDGAPALDVCASGVVRMEPLVRSCGFATALELAMADACDGILPTGTPRVLWFEAGGDYLIEEPAVIDTLGVVVRGDGAPIYADDPPDWRRQGSVLRCATSGEEACLTLRRPPAEEARGGFVYEGLGMVRVASDSSAEASAIGLRLVNVEDATVRDAFWESFDGTALDVRGAQSSSFVDLTFVSVDERGGTAVSLSCAEPNEPGGYALCPSGSVLSGLHVEGYETGVEYVGGNATTIERSMFSNSRRNAIRVDGAQALIVSGCRFMDVQESPSLADAYIQVIRDQGWWYPDVTVETSYFQCHCRPGRWPISSSIGGTSTVPVPRVALVGNTVDNCPEGILQRGDARTVWECDRNRALQRVSTSPTRFETWSVDDCSTDDALPPWPETCFD